MPACPTIRPTSVWSVRTHAGSPDCTVSICLACKLSVWFVCGWACWIDNRLACRHSRELTRWLSVRLLCVCVCRELWDHAVGREGLLACGNDERHACWLSRLPGNAHAGCFVGVSLCDL